MIEKTQLVRGVIQRSREHGYHILGEDGVAYAVNLTDWHNLEDDYQVGGRKYLIGKRAEFVPSVRTDKQGLHYADNVVVPLDAALKAKERAGRQMRGVARSMSPNYTFPEERES